MSRFKRLFNNIQQRPAKIPFLMLGDPNPELSLAAINALIQGGADALELGFPFSDPIADGPIIQQAASRASKQGVTTSCCFDIIKKIRERYDLPIGLLVYANLVFYQGTDAFYQTAHAAGIDAILIPDVPVQEALPFVQAAKQHHISPILMATPSCSEQTLLELAQYCEDYTYVVTRSGVTGNTQQCKFDEARAIALKLTTVNAPPAVFGFGIQSALDVQKAYMAGAKGVIIGSTLIHTIAQMTPQEILDGSKIIALMQSLYQKL